jgi:hypothetical protein
MIDYERTMEDFYFLHRRTCDLVSLQKFIKCASVVIMAKWNRKAMGQGQGRKVMPLSQFRNLGVSTFDHAIDY